MADRRSDDSPTKPSQPPESVQDPPGQRDLTERINAGHASSAPGPPDETEGKGTRSTGEKFAAALTKATQSKDKPPNERPAGSTAAQAHQPVPARRVRKARLRLTHVDPWSVMKTAFLLAVALGIVTVVAVGVVWSVLGAAGVWESINSTVSDVVGETGDDFRVEDYLGMSRVMGFTMIVAVVDVVLVTVIATLGAFLYNLAAALLGGLEVVLAEEDR